MFIDIKLFVSIFYTQKNIGLKALLGASNFINSKEYQVLNPFMLDTLQTNTHVNSEDPSEVPQYAVPHMRQHCLLT